MASNWKDIWNKPKDVNNIELQNLINAAGFKTSGLKAVELTEFITSIANDMNMKSMDSVYEVGCGSGSILSIMNSLDMSVGGLDYSESLLTITKSLKITEDLTHTEALNLDTQRKYDYTIAMSCFQYFPDIKYVEAVVDKMLDKSNKKSIAILDINDSSMEDIFLKIRRKAEPNYDEMYKEFKHLFIAKSFWIDYAKRNNLQCSITQQDIKGYTNSKFRYNVFLKK